ncbi:radical SAM protein [Saccharicrinis aurantiacus]|uniref:radical SAM protein n=1 Tax=Saccharicrinis aurantiacus TaxID=1849719 RepID=UPI0009F88F07|nr:radical SAM protein [Saccharicrinis aurantiacus]
MCYFSNMEQRKKMKGIIPESDFAPIANTLFKKAFQVYIGCGAEPTTHRNFTSLVRLARQYNVPDIGIVTNGQLLTDDQIRELIELKLSEITISCHGVKKDTYEHFMTTSKYDRFLSTLERINRFKEDANSKFPEIRINYTVNNKNLSELSNFFNVFEKYNIRTLQIRPVLNIGGKYSDAIEQGQFDEYNQILADLKDYSSQNNIRLLANTTNVEFKKKNRDGKVADAVYTYIGPKTEEQLGNKWEEMTFKKYIKATGWRKNTLQFLFKKQNSKINKSVANYEIIS